MTQPRAAIDLIKPAVRNRPGMRPFKVDPTFHRMQWNENPFDFPADLKEEVLERLAQVPWSRYPLGFRNVDLIDAVARFYGLPGECAVVGNGSSDLLRVAIHAVLQPGDHLVTLAPTFGAYKGHAQILDGVVHEVALDPAEGFALPVESIIRTAAEHRAKLIVICAPNNPTGTVYSLDDIRRIVQEVEGLVLVDEAYAEFQGQDFLPLLHEADNVVLVHTLSKAYAMAGVRVGYALSNSAIAGELQKLVNTFTLSPFSEIAALVALENAEKFQPFIERVVAERERLADALGQLAGVHVFPSGTNFLLAHLGRPAAPVQEYLRDHQRMLVTDMAMYPGYADYMRISVGAPQENDLLLSGIREYLAQAEIA